MIKTKTNIKFNTQILLSIWFKSHTKYEKYQELQQNKFRQKKPVSQ